MTRNMHVYSKFTDIYSYIKNILFLTVLLTVGVTSAWAQTDYSGIYYIANDKALEDQTTFNYNNSTTADRYYIVPAKDPSLGDNKDAYYSENYNTSDGDPEKPYLTTYKTNQDVNSIWVLKSDESDDNKYFFIHLLTGKYAVYHTTPDCTSKKHRKVIHLETLPNPESVDIAKFYIENGPTSTFTFRPQSLSSSHRYFNPSNGNKDQYNAAGGDCNNAGLIGVYEKADASNRGSLWHLESALLAASTISINTAGYPTVTVTNTNTWLPSGYHYRYTFGDGTQADPTASSPILEGGSYTVTTSGTLKVVIEQHGVVLSEVASQEVGPAKPTFTVNANGSVTISATGATIYYTLDGSDPKSSGTRQTYSESISESAIASATGTAIKAIVVDANDVISMVAELPLATYTYKIVNRSYKVAAIKAKKQAEGTPLSDYNNIPAEIRSEYLSGENVYFRSFTGSEGIGDAVTQETLSGYNAIHQTPGGNANIYVTYDTDHLGEKTPRLQGARPFNIKYGSTYLYDEGGTLKTDGASESNEVNHVWYFTGGDPYAVTVQNGATSSKLTYQSAAFGYNGTVKTFIIKNTTSDRKSVV